MNSIPLLMEIAVVKLDESFTQRKHAIFIQSGTRLMWHQVDKATIHATSVEAMNAWGNERFKISKEKLKQTTSLAKV